MADELFLTLPDTTLEVILAREDERFFVTVPDRVLEGISAEEDNCFAALSNGTL